MSYFVLFVVAISLLVPYSNASVTKNKKYYVRALGDPGKRSEDRGQRVRSEILADR